MAVSKTRSRKGIIIVPDADALEGIEGEIKIDSADSKIKATLGASAREVLTNSQTQSISNKTIDADANTITNIENADIKSGAAIDAAKIADGSVSNAEFQYLDGVTSAIQTQLNSKADGASFSSHTGASTGVHGVVGSVVGTSDAQALTNKIIDADLNTISNIDNNEIKALAGIDATKIADGSVDNTEFQFLDGVTSAIQTQINSKQATITGAATSITSANLTASRALTSDGLGKVAASAVTSTEQGYLSGVTSAIQTQINSKVNSSGGTLTNGSLVTPIRSDVKQDTLANLTTYALTATNGQLVFATDSKLMYQVVDGLLKAVGSGTGGTSDVDALLTQNFDTAILSEFTQTGLVLATTSRINGAATPLLIHQAGSPQSFKQTITVDRKYRSQLMQLSLQNRSTASEGNLVLKVRNETGSVDLIVSDSIATGSQAIASLGTTSASATVTGFTNSVINSLSIGMSVTGTGIPTGTTILTINSAALTITLSANATATGTVTLRFSALPARRAFSFTIPSTCASLSYTITALQEAGLPESYVDDVVIKLASTALLETSFVVPKTTAWAAYTPTFQGFGTATNVEFQWRQNGENAEIRGKFTSGTSTAVEARVGLPAGLSSAGTGVIPSIQELGTLIRNQVIGGGYYTLIEPSVTYLTLSATTASNNAFTKINGDAFGSGNLLSFVASVPCAGLSATETKTVALTQSGLITTADSMIRLDTFSAFGTTNTMIPRFSNLRQSIGSDVRYEDSVSLGVSFNILKDGTYSITYSSGVITDGSYIGLSKNSTQLTTSIATINVTDRLALERCQTNAEGSVSWTGYLVAGDVIRPHTNANAPIANDRVHFTISKEGSLKQVSVNPDSKITIPTSELRFEGASTRGTGLNTAIVRFDTQAKIRGDAFSVVSDATFGTVVTMLKAGKLDVSTAMRCDPASSNTFNISKNQAVLTSQPVGSEVVAYVQLGTAAGTTQVSTISYSGFVSVGDVFRVSANISPNTDVRNQLNFSFQEQSISVSVSNTLPQFSDSDSSVRVDTANGYGSSGTKIRRFSNVRDNIGVDVEYVDSVINGASFTAKSSGIYHIVYSDRVDTATFFGLSKNASSLTTNLSSLSGVERLSSTQTSTVGTYSLEVSWVGFLSSGDIVRPHFDATPTGGNPQLASFTMSKVGKPNVTGVDVTPFVNVPQPESQSSYRYTNTTFTTATITGVETRTSGSSIFSYNSATGIYTFLKSSIVNATISGNFISGTAIYVYIRRNGNIEAQSTQVNGGRTTSAAYTERFQVGDTISFSTNDGVNDIRMNVTATALSDQILTAPETFSTDTAALQYASSAAYTLATLQNAPVGTFITFTYAASTSTRTQTTTAPTQTTADMNANGMLIYTRAFNAASTAGNPVTIAVQIGKGLKGKSLDLYKSAGKVTVGSLDLYRLASNYVRGAFSKDYNEVTGILFVDCGISESSDTIRDLYFSDITSQTSGYLVINASKNPALVGIGLNRVAARAVSSSGQSISTETTITWDAAKTYDTHGALNTATGVFTSPETGYYSVQGSIHFQNATYSSGQAVIIYGYKNGINYSSGFVERKNTAVTGPFGTIYSDSVYLNKGDTFYLRGVNERGATAMVTTPLFNYFSIIKVSI